MCNVYWHIESFLHIKNMITNQNVFQCLFHVQTFWMKLKRMVKLRINRVSVCDTARSLDYCQFLISKSNKISQTGDWTNANNYYSWKTQCLLKSLFVVWQDITNLWCPFEIFSKRVFNFWLWENMHWDWDDLTRVGISHRQDWMVCKRFAWRPSRWLSWRLHRNDLVDVSGIWSMELCDFSCHVKIIGISAQQLIHCRLRALLEWIHALPSERITISWHPTTHVERPPPAVIREFLV
jgi:hypothetical protein